MHLFFALMANGFTCVAIGAYIRGIIRTVIMI
jgi:hypothetical protein